MSGVIRVTIAQATVADFRRIETRTGRPMVRFRAEVGKDRLAVIVFNEAAERRDPAEVGESERAKRQSIGVLGVRANAQSIGFFRSSGKTAVDCRFQIKP